MKTFSQSSCSIPTFTVPLPWKVLTRLDEITLIENIPKNKLIEKMIMGYVPVPALMIPGEFRSIYINEVHRMRRLKPHAIVISLYWNSKLGMPLKIRNELRDGIITIEEFQRKYIERLMLPDAQEEITRLRKLKETNDVFITSFEPREEKSMRKIFVEFINGRLVWK